MKWYKVCSGSCGASFEPPGQRTAASSPENGWGNASTSEAEDVKDLVRCNYYRSYVGNMASNAVANKIDVLGYFAWSIMTYVDFETQVRTPKLSMRWFKSVTSLKELPAGGVDALPKCEDFL